jgi:hypothetical protein
MPSIFDSREVRVERLELSHLSALRSPLSANFAGGKI